MLQLWISSSSSETSFQSNVALTDQRQISVESKLAQLEKRFAKLKSKFISLTKKSDASDSDSSRKTKDAKISFQSTASSSRSLRSAIVNKVEEHCKQDWHTRKSEEEVFCWRQNTCRHLQKNENDDLVDCDEFETSSDVSSKEKAHAVVLRKRIEQTYFYETIKMLNSNLRKLLKKILKHYSNLYFVEK